MRRALVNPPNAGFLRPRANLAVVVLADEDDCSLAASVALGAESSILGPRDSFLLSVRRPVQRAHQHHGCKDQMLRLCCRSAPPVPPIATTSSQTRWRVRPRAITCASGSAVPPRPPRIRGPTSAVSSDSDENLLDGVRSPCRSEESHGDSYNPISPPDHRREPDRASREGHLKACRSGFRPRRCRSRTAS